MIPLRRLNVCLFVLLTCSWGALPAKAQERALPQAETLARWANLIVPPGHEPDVSSKLEASLSGWKTDEHGNLMRRVGNGHPRRVIACGLDRPGYAVTQITDDGYLRLHRVGRSQRHPLWDQNHEGQQVSLITRSGVVLGVAAVANAHFFAQHRGETNVVTADDLWVDVGAESREEVADFGIQLLDPLVRRMPAWAFGEWAAGPDVGARAGCAALASLAEAPVVDGETIFLITAMSSFGWIGLGSAIADLGTVDELTLVGVGTAKASESWQPTAELGFLDPVLRSAGVESVRSLAPAIRYPGSLVESIRLAEAERLRQRVARAAGTDPEANFEWLDVPSQGIHESAGDQRDKLDETAHLLASLADLYGPSGHEQPVRRAVLEAMPSWARQNAEVDRAGNVVVALGPPRRTGEASAETLVFIAHLDEVGYQVDAVRSDGTVELTTLGGPVDSAWEGQPALLHFDDHPGESSEDRKEPLPGVFVPRDAPETRHPDALTAWFGMDADALLAVGVKPGLAVTSPKQALRLGGNRFTARSLDDRAGTAALLLALRKIDPAKLEQPVVFAWTTEEESGLLGAKVLAERLGTSALQVYSVDTFVSSDTPLESPHFAHTPLGQGPVLRAAESSGVAPIRVRERVQRIASRAGIPLQLGLTQGGTDGTTFTFWGVPNIGLSWPGRYSHSPVEVLDLRDLELLVDLVVAVATTVH